MEASHLMSGSISFACWIGAIFFQVKSRTPCRKELSKVLLKRVRQWRNRDQWIWWSGTSWVRRKILRKDSSDSNFPEIQSWIRVMFHRASGNWCETATKTQQHILKSGDKMTLYLRAPRHWCGVVNLQVQLRKLERGDDIQIGRITLKFLKKQVSDYRYLEKVFKNLRQNLNLAEEAPVLNLRTNVLIWWSFMSTTMKADIHPGPNYVEDLEENRNTNFEELQNLFDITQKLILNHQAEILNVTTIDWTAPSWGSTLTHDQVIRWTKAKSTCLLRLRIMLRRNVRSFRSESKTEKSSKRIATI